MEIATVGQCVLELILNALDAKTTGVAVRFNSDKERIQIIDSGEGIPPNVFVRIGETKKKNENIRVTCYTHFKRGESLEQIINLSQNCIITSKYDDSPTYEKEFRIGEPSSFLKKNWLDKGTVVTIHGFKGSGWDSALHRIYFVITSLALIYTDVSFTLKDEKTGKLVVAINKPHEPYSILNIICQQTISLKTSWYLSSQKSLGFKISGYIGFLGKKSNFVRYIFVNRRSANCLQMQKLIIETMKEVNEELKIFSMDSIYFVIFIQCSELDFILSSYEGRTFVIFEEWAKFANIVKNCLLNTIRMNSDNFIKQGTSSLQENFKLYENYENKEDYLGKTKNFLTRRSNEENCLNISNQSLEKKMVSVATQTSQLSSVKKLDPKKQLKTKKLEAKSIFLHNRKKFGDEKPFSKKEGHSKAKGNKKKALLTLINDSEETSGNPLKAKLKKFNPLQIPKKSLNDIFNRQISKSSTLINPLMIENNQQTVTPKETQKETKKPLVDKKLKSKKNSILRKNENLFKKRFGSHKITMTQLSFLKKNRRDKLREQRQKREEEKQNVLKRKQEQFFENKEKTNDLEFSPEERIIKKMKINNEKQMIITPRRNHEIVEQFLKSPENSLEINPDFLFRPKEEFNNKRTKEQHVSKRNHDDIVEQFLANREKSNELTTNNVKQMIPPRSTHEIVEQFLKSQEKNPNFLFRPDEEFINQKTKEQHVSKRNYDDIGEQFLVNQENNNEKQMMIFPRKNHDFIEQFSKSQEKKPEFLFPPKVFENQEKRTKMIYLKIFPDAKPFQAKKIESKEENNDNCFQHFSKHQKILNGVPDLKICPDDKIIKRYEIMQEQRTELGKKRQEEMRYEENCIDVDEIEKLNVCQNVINWLQKNRQYFDESIDKDIFKHSRNNEVRNNSQFERRIQLNNNEKNFVYEKEEDRAHEELNNFKKPENHLMEVFSNDSFEFLPNQEYSQIQKTRDDDKSIVTNQSIVNQFVTGENDLKLVNVNNYCQKIDSEHCSQLSEWSDWNYVGPITKDFIQFSNSKKVDDRRLYYFLPPIFNSMLPFEKFHILSEANIQNDMENVSTIFKPQLKPDQIVSRYQNLNVRLCVVPRPNEFKLNRKTLYSIEILRQINSEFISAIAVQDNSRLLLMIDQHAADERIRYEYLLQSYRIDRTKQYYSIVLDHPILIPDMEPEKIKLLVVNRKLLGKFGIQFKFNSIGDNLLMVTNVPRCFLRRKSEYSEYKLFCSVKNLLLEIVESLETTNGVSILPKSIHKSIASEACRGAIKFGDQLTNNQCSLLIKSLRKAKAPNRCAHGRPAIFPLLDLTNLKKKQKKSFQV